MRRFAGFAALLAALWISVAAAVPAPAPHVAWRGWNDGLSAAVRSGKPVIVDVYTDWCGWCKRMDRDVYARSDVGDYLNGHFVMVRLNAESGERVLYSGRTLTARSLASGFDVTGYPTTIFLKSDGTHLVNVPGYVPAEKFMKLVRYIGDGHMERGESWEEYSRPAPAN